MLNWAPFVFPFRIPKKASIPLSVPLIIAPIGSLLLDAVVVGKKNNILILLTEVAHYASVNRLALARRSSGVAIGNEMKSRSAMVS